MEQEAYPRIPKDDDIIWVDYNKKQKTEQPQNPMPPPQPSNLKTPANPPSSTAGTNDGQDDVTVVQDSSAKE